MPVCPNCDADLGAFSVWPCRHCGYDPNDSLPRVGPTHHDEDEEETPPVPPPRRVPRRGEPYRPPRRSNEDGD